MTLSIETITIQDIKNSDAVTLDEFVATLEPGCATLWALGLIMEHRKETASYVFFNVGLRSQSEA